LSREHQGNVRHLVENVAPDLLNYFLRRVDTPADAADLLGDALLVIARRPAAVPTDADEARLWAFGVARKTLATGRRSARRRSALLERLREEISLDAHQADDSHDALYAALASVDAFDREIIRLIHWEGFSQEEVARILGKPPGTIRSRYTRARAELRALLAVPNLA
jgi:RNA polymerase sigma-70 factor (ECF subfamily)